MEYRKELGGYKVSMGGKERLTRLRSARDTNTRLMDASDSGEGKDRHEDKIKSRRRGVTGVKLEKNHQAPRVIGWGGTARRIHKSSTEDSKDRFL